MLDRQTCRDLGVPQYVKLPIPAYAIQIRPENYDLLRREERLDQAHLDACPHLLGGG